MDTDICASCGKDAMLYEKTGWCLECSGIALGIHLIVCDTCHKIRTVDYALRRTCSTCRERNLGHMRPCGVCETGRRYRTRIMCNDCQEAYGHVLHENQLLQVANSAKKRYKWSDDKWRTYIRKKVKERVHDSDTSHI